MLVLGASGSVGSLAAQILKAEHAIVIGSCSSDAMPMVQTLGVDHIIDYTDESSSNAFSQCGPYDLILDCAGQGQDGALKYGWQFKEFVTFSAPLLRNVDEHGLIFGMAKNVADLATANIKTLSTKQACVKWAYFVPSLRGIEHLKCLVERKKVSTILYFKKINHMLLFVISSFLKSIAYMVSTRHRKLIRKLRKDIYAVKL